MNLSHIFILQFFNYSKGFYRLKRLHCICGEMVNWGLIIPSPTYNLYLNLL